VTFDVDVVVTTTANRTCVLFDAYKSPPIGGECCAAGRCRRYEAVAGVGGGRVSMHQLCSNGPASTWYMILTNSSLPRIPFRTCLFCGSIIYQVLRVAH